MTTDSDAISAELDSELVALKALKQNVRPPQRVCIAQNDSWSQRAAAIKEAEESTAAGTAIDEEAHRLQLLMVEVRAEIQTLSASADSAGRSACSLVSVAGR
jgi:hypothetical protein